MRGYSLRAEDTAIQIEKTFFLIRVSVCLVIQIFMTKLFVWIGILITFLTLPLQARVTSDSVNLSKGTVILSHPVSEKRAFATSLEEDIFNRRFTPWSVKTNLLYDALLTPSLEIEYRISKHWSVGLEGALASWSNAGRHKYYHLAFISPEARYWFQAPERRKGHYVGLFAGGGWYDLQNGGRGYRGEGKFAGVSYGYQFPVGNYFSFEAGVGIGYLNTTYDEYLPVDKDYVYQQTSKINYIGPLKLKFAWVWHIGRCFEKKGGNA